MKKYKYKNLLEDMEEMFEGNQCEHKYIVKQKKPFYIIQCSICNSTIHCSKKAYKWFLNFAENLENLADKQGW